MAGKAPTLASSLVDQIGKLPLVLTTTHIDELSTGLGELIDLLPNRLFGRGCGLLDSLSIYRVVAGICFHKDRPASFAATDQALLTSKTILLKRVLLSYLDGVTVRHMMWARRYLDIWPNCEARHRRTSFHGSRLV